MQLKTQDFLIKSNRIAVKRLSYNLPEIKGYWKGLSTNLRLYPRYLALGYEAEGLHLLVFDAQMRCKLHLISTFGQLPDTRNHPKIARAILKDYLKSIPKSLHVWGLKGL
jgi:hypothetical protein